MKCTFRNIPNFACFHLVDDTTALCRVPKWGSLPFLCAFASDILLACIEEPVFIRTEAFVASSGGKLDRRK